MGTVIGRVTLSVKNEKFFGERLLLTLPWNRESFAQAAAAQTATPAAANVASSANPDETGVGEPGEPTVFDPSIVVFDHLGAGIGQRIAISEGAEAAAPFPKPTPVDAYCAALVDHHEYTPPPEGT